MIKHKRYDAPVNRGIQFIVAIPMAFFGILATSVSFLIFYFFAIGRDVHRNAVWAAAIFLPVGIFCFLIMWRLLTGRSGRKDGGLFSPIVLRIFGAMFLSSPILFLIMRSYMIIESIFSVAAGFACFRLASRRESLATQNVVSKIAQQSK